MTPNPPEPPFPTMLEETSPTMLEETSPTMLEETPPTVEEPPAAKRRKRSPERPSSTSFSGNSAPTPARASSAVGELQQIEDAFTGVFVMAGMGLSVATDNRSATGVILAHRAATGGELARKLAAQDPRVRRALMVLLKGSTWVEVSLFLGAIGAGVAIDLGRLPADTAAMVLPELKDLSPGAPLEIKFPDLGALFRSDKDSHIEPLPDPIPETAVSVGDLIPPPVYVGDLI
jgi:hypothetical protein